MFQTVTSAVEVGTTGLSRSDCMGSWPGLQRQARSPGLARAARGDSSGCSYIALLRHAQLSQVALR